MNSLDYTVTSQGRLPPTLAEKLAQAQAEAIKTSSKSGRKTDEKVS